MLFLINVKSFSSETRKMEALQQQDVRHKQLRQWQQHEATAEKLQ